MEGERVGIVTQRLICVAYKLRDLFPDMVRFILGNVNRHRVRDRLTAAIKISENMSARHRKG